jgi:hypothetical protein
MKRVLLAMLAILVIPGMVLAASATIGVYVDGGKLYYSPAGAYTAFDAYLYVVQDQYKITGVQYMLETPSDPTHSQLVLLNIEFPFQYSIDIGDPWNGHAITYSPPVDHYPYGYAMLVKYEFLTQVDCPDMLDYLINVVDHPDTGLWIPECDGLYATYPPNHEPFCLDGLTTTLCPTETDAEEESWGAIKSMYK